METRSIIGPIWSLRRFFGIDDRLDEKSAPHIWERVNEQLAGGGFGARDLIEKSNVETVVTTDDPTDSFEYHVKLKDEDFNVSVLPGFRPDKAMEINQEGFAAWVRKLETASGMKIANYDDFLKALKNRIDFFHEAGGRISDHAINQMMYTETDESEVRPIFAKVMNGESASPEEECKFKSLTLHFLGTCYAEKGWAMQAPH